MHKDDLEHVIRGLTSFAVVAGEMPAVDVFGWADSSSQSASATA
jgi:hypothetical protein